MHTIYYKIFKVQIINQNLHMVFQSLKKNSNHKLYFILFFIVAYYIINFSDGFDWNIIDYIFIYGGYFNISFSQYLFKCCNDKIHYNFKIYR